MHKALIAALLFFSCTQSAFAQRSPWSWGAGVAESQDVYRDFDSRIVPIPVIAYQGENLRFYGPFVSYRFYSQDNFFSELLLQPTFAGYQESDSHTFTGMDDRDFSLAAGVRVNYKWQKWQLSVDGVHDVLSVNEGYQLGARLSYPWKVGVAMIEPGISRHYWDKNYINYYYGVKTSEATAWRPAYEADAGVNSELDLSVRVFRVWGGMLGARLSYTVYDSSIDDSPLTDSNSAFGTNIYFSKSF